MPADSREVVGDERNHYDEEDDPADHQRDAPEREERCAPTSTTFHLSSEIRRRLDWMGDGGFSTPVCRVGQRWTQMLDPAPRAKKATISAATRMRNRNFDTTIPPPMAMMSRMSNSNQSIRP